MTMRQHPFWTEIAIATLLEIISGVGGLSCFWDLPADDAWDLDADTIELYVRTFAWKNTPEELAPVLARLARRDT